MTEATDHPLRFEVGQRYSDGRSEVYVRRGDEALHSDTLNLASAKSRSKFIATCQEKFPGLLSDDTDALETSLIQLADQSAQLRSQAPAETSPANYESLVRSRDEAADAALAEMPEEVVAEAKIMLADPRLVERIQRDLASIGIVGEEDLRLMSYVVGTSRLLAEPLAGIVQGLSSSGKSYVVEKASTLIPPEGVLRTTDLTANALYYLDEGALIHTFVGAGERARGQEDDRAEETRALREMISSHVLRKTIPVKSESGSFRSETIERYGPIAFIESTTLTKIFDEDANRALLLATDESPEQTRRIITHAARQAAGAPTSANGILQRHFALHRLLRRVEVRIPFAEAIADKMPDGRPEARRAVTHIISVIRAVALLHQRQRHPAGGELQHGEVVEALLDDYAVAREILVAPLGRTLGSDLTPAIANFGQRVVERWRGEKFTAVQAAERDQTIKAPDVARRYLNALVGPGVVQVVEAGKAGKPNVYDVVGEVPVPGAIWLPSVEDLRDTGVDRDSPHPAAAGRLVRQPAEGPQQGDSGAKTGSDWRPEASVRLGTPGRQPAEGDSNTATWRTSRTKPDQEGWSPENGPLEPLDGHETANGPAGDQTHQPPPQVGNIGQAVGRTAEPAPGNLDPAGMPRVLAALEAMGSEVPASDPLVGTAEVDTATEELERALRRHDADDFRRAVNLLDILTGEQRTDALVDDIVAEFRVPEPSPRRIPHIPQAVSLREPAGPRRPRDVATSRTERAPAQRDKPRANPGTESPDGLFGGPQVPQPHPKPSD